MKYYRIRFVNIIKPATIEIKYRAVLEDDPGVAIFAGQQTFYRQHLQTILLSTGDVALKSVNNIFTAIPTDYVLNRILFEQSQDRQILSVPSKSAFDSFIVRNNNLDHVKFHLSDAGKAIIDTKLITELRIG